jgi:hypothetical protein
MLNKYAFVLESSSEDEAPKPVPDTKLAAATWQTKKASVADYFKDMLQDSSDDDFAKVIATVKKVPTKIAPASTKVHEESKRAMLTPESIPTFLPS